MIEVKIYLANEDDACDNCEYLINENNFKYDIFSSNGYHIACLCERCVKELAYVLANEIIK